MSTPGMLTQGLINLTNYLKTLQAAGQMLQQIKRVQRGPINPLAVQTFPLITITWGGSDVKTPRVGQYNLENGAVWVTLYINAQQDVEQGHDLMTDLNLDSQGSGLIDALAAKQGWGTGVANVNLFLRPEKWITNGVTMQGGPGFLFRSQLRCMAEMRPLVQQTPSIP